MSLQDRLQKSINKKSFADVYEKYQTTPMLSGFQVRQDIMRSLQSEIVKMIKDAVEKAESVAQKVAGDIVEKELEKARKEIEESLQDSKNQLSIYDALASNIKALKGTKGDKGDKGDKGEIGLIGLRGDKGATGPRGPQGIQGIRGERGEMGEKGDMPIAGVDYLSEKQIHTFIKETIPFSQQDVKKWINDLWIGFKMTEKADEIARALETLQANQRLDYDALKNKPGIPAYDTRKKFGGRGGGGISVLTPLEIANSDRTVFTVTEEPRFIIADGIIYFAGAGYTYAGGLVTMTIPPTTTIRYIV